MKQFFGGDPITRKIFPWERPNQIKTQTKTQPFTKDKLKEANYEPHKEVLYIWNRALLKIQIEIERDITIAEGFCCHAAFGRLHR